MSVMINVTYRGSLAKSYFVKKFLIAASSVGSWPGGPVSFGQLFGTQGVSKRAFSPCLNEITSPVFAATQIGAGSVGRLGGSAPDPYVLQVTSAQVLGVAGFASQL